ncbi:MAG: prepilin peptidase [Actinobacteria bacterium]|nr:MAG: prepilin peptidase [Actinomycetota bacterium]
MNPAFAALALAPGLAIGSFLNVVAARVPLRRSLVRPASACMSCSKPIAWHDNVPVVSYLVLRGRCRSCGASIGLVYPAVELASALLVAGCVLAFGLTLHAAIAAFFCCVLVAISAVDLKHRIVPDRIVLPATVVVLVAQTVREPSLEWPLAAFGASLFLFLAVLAYPAGMGMGDVKLALLMGAALGKLVTVALMVGMFSALVPGLYLLARHGQAARKMAIPFAPFLAFGSIVTLFAGNSIFDAYVRLLGV